MILPTTYALAMLLTVLSMVCWGSWANTFKMTKNWRFELFYFDFSFGVLLTGVIAAFTLGSMGDDLTFMDNLLIAGKRAMGYSLAAGLIFNLANMLLLGAVSLTGMAVAFPVSLGVALLIGVVWGAIANPIGNGFLVTAGAVLVLAAIAVVAFAYRAHAEEDGEITEDFSVKGLVIALVSGILLGCYLPLVEMSRVPDVGLGAYSVVFFFSIGVFLSTFIYNLYFMNLPVEGEPVGFGQYFNDGSFGKHLLGILGGVLWCVGMIASLTASSSTAPVGAAITYGLTHGSMVLATLWGLLVWREFAGSEMRVKLLLAILVVLMTSGIALISIAPLYVTK